jgi:GxxExxY protein
MNEERLPMWLNDLSFQVIGAAMEVHRVLGAGFIESVYEEALCYELAERKIPFERQKEISVYYKGQAIGRNRLDMLVKEHLILELKAIERFEAIHTAQAISYLKATDLKLCLLINFNVTILKEGIRRIVL